MFFYFISIKWISMRLNVVIIGELRLPHKLCKMVPKFYTRSHMLQETIFDEEDVKISYFQGLTCPPFLVLAINKFSNSLIWSENSKIWCGVMICAFMHAEKDSSNFDIGLLYMLHKGRAPFWRTLNYNDMSPHDLSISNVLSFQSYFIWCNI